MHCTVALSAADTTLDEGAWGCKTRVAGAQSLHTCVPAQPHMHLKYIICCTVQYAAVFAVCKGRLVISHEFDHQCMDAQRRISQNSWLQCI